MEINYFGKPFSFTHIAALRRYKKNHKYNSIATISKTIEASLNNANSVAVVPIENTTGGVIYDTVDTLTMAKYLTSDMVILEEIELNIQLFLLGNKGVKLSQIKKIYSHEYALKRAGDWISQHMGNDIKLEQAMSTSVATQQIKKEKYAGAIASIEAAKHYNLEKLAEITKDGKKNITRFFILGKNGHAEKRI